LIVVDASATVELLLRTKAGARLAERLLDGDEATVAPHLLDVEVAQALRRAASRDIGEGRASQALEDLADLPCQRFPHHVFLQRIWQLRASLSAYDAAYVALAEGVEATLITADRRLARAPGLRCKVEVLV
jgi:predicted nucleic acid-binding protein